MEIAGSRGKRQWTGIHSCKYHSILQGYVSYLECTVKTRSKICTTDHLKFFNQQQKVFKIFRSLWGVLIGTGATMSRRDLLDVVHQGAREGLEREV